jgi:hypothetical protein
MWKIENGHIWMFKIAIPFKYSVVAGTWKQTKLQEELRHESRKENNGFKMKD